MKRNLATALAIAADLVAVAAAAAMVSGPAYADDITIDTTPFTSTRTRAEVQAELMNRSQMVSNGASEWGMYNQPQARSAYTSEQAKAEYKVSRQYVNAITGEDSGSAYFIKQTVPHDPAATMGGPAR
ncbi:MAG TPA: hypothetical protein VNN06_18795 [Ramlibacter sp.]|nr:hypothetical protein [Ramlibacter sp.]